MSESAPSLPPIDASLLRPYLSVVVLTFPSGLNSPGSLFRSALLRFVEKQHARNGATLVADGLDGEVSADVTDDLEASADAFVYQKEMRPGWAVKGSPFLEQKFSLCAWITRQNWIAIACDGTLEAKLQKWLDKPPLPPFSRVPPGVINATLLSGDATNLWLRGAHGRRRTKADAKTLSGQSVGEALNPLEDSTFALGSARARVDVKPEFSALTGIIGVTPRKSKVWLSSTQSFAEFRETCTDLLRALSQTSVNGTQEENPYPLLATERSSLADVSRAYEVVWCDPDDLPVADITDDLLKAHETLERATFLVKGGTGARFVADVGLDGRVGGRLACTPSLSGSRLNLSFGFDGQPTDPDQVRPVLDALSFTQLLTVYYESGHTLTQDAIWKTKVEDREFPAWQWESFAGYDVTREKPNMPVAQDIHDTIGKNDRSLFSWVLQHFGHRGYLTCDDGTNELADFVLVGDGGELSLIHVKGARTNSLTRQISATSLEVVTGQAAKNLRNLDGERLAGLLTAAPVASPAVWLYGKREANRDDMINFLKTRSARAQSTVVIVQPHITEAARARALSPVASRSESHRLRLVEMLLNNARGGAVGIGSELIVIGDSLRPAGP